MLNFASAERKIPMSLISPSHIINYKDQLDNIIFTNAKYSFRMGEGTQIQYDFESIQKELGQRFLLSKPIILFEEQETEFPEQVKMVDYLRRLNTKIQQDKLSDLDWNTIEGELYNPAEVSEVISLLEMVAHFTSAEGGKPHEPIKTYLHETLKYPKNKDLISKKANEACCLKHLLTLWHKLTIHRSEIYVFIGQLPFPSLPSNYLEDAELSLVQELKRTVTDLEGLKTLLHDFIAFNLSVTEEAYNSTSSLRNGLINYSKGELIFSSYREFNFETILSNFTVSQAVSIWTKLVRESRRKRL